jgi:hypothetical protein
MSRHGTQERLGIPVESLARQVKLLDFLRGECAVAIVLSSWWSLRRRMGDD